MKRLSVIVSNISGEVSTEEFLPSIIDACDRYKGKKEILFVLQDNKDNTYSIVNRMAKHCDFLSIVKPKDYENNLSTKSIGAKRARGDVLFFVDDNVELEPEFFEKAEKNFDKNFFMLGVCGYNYYSGKQQDGIKILSWRKGKINFSDNIYNRALKKDRVMTYQTFAVQGAYFFVDSRRFELLGGFDDDLFKDYLIEADIAYRGLKRGWNILYNPNLNAYHKTGVSKLRSSKRLQIIVKRNRMLFVWKNIRSFPLFLRHISWNIVKIFDIQKWKAFLKALPKLGIVLRRRKIEKKYTKISDIKVLKAAKDYKKYVLRKSSFKPRYSYNNKFKKSRR